MNSRMITNLLVLTAFAAACDSIPFIGGGSDAAQDDSLAADVAAPSTPAPAQPDSATADAATPPPTPPAQPQPPQPAPSRPAQQQAQRPVIQGDEVPWTPERTGTVRPGMTSEEVRGEWGEPAVERTNGQWTFMYYRNGCERTCGTFDVVFLQGGQVVDAIVRGMGHEYAGISSSPADRPASFTPPAGNMQPDSLRIRG